MNIFALANPKRFMDVSGPLVPWLGGLSVTLLGVGLYLGFAAPPDALLQGDAMKIMFVHVPAAWIAMMAYGLIAVASFVSMVWRHPLADVAARSAAPLGAVFAALALVTGSIWGKAMWNRYWVWDARLTSFLLLFFVYLGYIALWSAIEDEVRAARATAILALVGAVDLLVIKFSVDWVATMHQCDDFVRISIDVWFSQHQCKEAYRADSPVAAVFVWPLLAMALGYTLLFFTLWTIRIRTEIIERRARAILLAGPA